MASLTLLSLPGHGVISYPQTTTERHRYRTTIRSTESTSFTASETKGGRGRESKLTCLVELMRYSIGFRDTFHAENLHLDVVPTCDGIGHVRDGLLVNLPD